MFLHVAPGCVLKVLSKVCVSKLHEETKERGEQGAQIKAHFLRFLCDSSSTLLLLFCREEGEIKKDKRQQGKNLFPLCSQCFFLYTFSIDLNFS